MVVRQLKPLLQQLLLLACVLLAVRAQDLGFPTGHVGTDDSHDDDKDDVAPSTPPAWLELVLKGEECCPSPEVQLGDVWPVSSTCRPIQGKAQLADRATVSFASLTVTLAAAAGVADTRTVRLSLYPKPDCTGKVVAQDFQANVCTPLWMSYTLRGGMPVDITAVKAGQQAGDWLPVLPHPAWHRRCSTDQAQINATVSWSVECDDARERRVVRRALQRVKQRMLLESAPVAAYRRTIFEAVEPPPEPVGVVKSVRVVVSPSAVLAIEGYSITIDADTGDNITIAASTSVGAMRAMETLAQLAQWNGVHHTVPSCLQIRDQPRFPWRGVLVDTALHYVPEADLKLLLDAMEWTKMNVLHWHIVDADAWPLELPPPLDRLAQLGSYSAGTRGKATYSMHAVRRIVHHAHDRGIQVVPELDLPGHCASIAKAYPSLVCSCFGSIERHILDPTQAETWTLVDELLNAFVHVFPATTTLHLGGDEVKFDCWDRYPAIWAWMQRHQMHSYTQLWQYFVEQIDRRARARGVGIAVWGETVLQGVQMPHDTVVMPWQDRSDLSRVLHSGYKAVLSWGWYLDRASPVDQSHWAIADSWRDFYANEPAALITGANPAALLANVLGGEVSSWGESQDSTNIHTRIWPRAAAAAERLWSPQSFNFTAQHHNIVQRLGLIRCAMLRRGLPAEPLFSDWCDPLPTKQQQQQQQQLERYTDDAAEAGMDETWDIRALGLALSWMISVVCAFVVGDLTARIRLGHSR